MSRVDIDRPDVDAFPKFRDAVSTELTLEAGQMLFIPFHWWHQVTSLEMSMSVNFWWNPPPS